MLLDEMKDRRRGPRSGRKTPLLQRVERRRGCASSPALVPATSSARPRTRSAYRSSTSSALRSSISRRWRVRALRSKSAPPRAPTRRSSTPSIGPMARWARSRWWSATPMIAGRRVAPRHPVEALALAGVLDYGEVAASIAGVPIPELADWCAFNVVENKRIRQTFVANRDPSKKPLRDAILKAAPPWEQHPLWQEMLTSGYQLLTEVSDDLLRKVAGTKERYRLLSRLGIRSSWWSRSSRTPGSRVSCHSSTRASRAEGTAARTRCSRRSSRCTPRMCWRPRGS